MKSNKLPALKMLTPDEELELITQWIRTRDQKLLLRLVRAFEPLVLKFARQFASYGVPKEELISVGNLALIEVAHRFKPELNLKFSTYASHWVRGTMLAFIASNYFSFAMKSQKMKKAFFRLRSLIVHEQNKTGTAEVSDEIMAKMSEVFEMEQTELEVIFQVIRQPSISLDEPARSGMGRLGDDTDHTTIGEMTASPTSSPEEIAAERSAEQYQRTLIYSTMEHVLSEREQIILKGQLLVDEDHEQTLQTLAKQFNLSRERIRQIRNNAYSKLELAIRRRCAQIDRRAFLDVGGVQPRKAPKIEKTPIDRQSQQGYGTVVSAGR